ncbi:uncharacterized protein L201_003141 [Kwoniella dendrophila CBS 6074]|uniref:Zn(2)-C6 fungal-type domain-containing protein n=1 Tax=Kwoniella dendrophila CBS 6074 TaxID=1295534 RepID=A0AAX4JUK5_9TREE
MPAVSKEKSRNVLARGEACQACKSRKVRCPAQKPACANCVRKNKECIYPKSPSLNPSPSLNIETSSAQPSTTLNHQAQENHISSSTSSTNTHPTTSDVSSGPLLPLDHLESLDNSPWTQEIGIVGLLPSMIGPVQSLPSPWESLNIADYLNDFSGDKEGFNGSDLNEMERDHLLLLYFTGHRVIGVDMHISSFYARLQSPDLTQRPHPCLLNAMYLMTCRGSPLESLRKMEKSFYRKAKQNMEEALQSHSSVFDAVRTGTMLAAWLFGSDRQLEGWAMMGQTVGLAIAVGLDRIESSTDINNNQKLHGATTYLPPAVSHIDLADRIYAFWTLFLVEKCVCIGFELSTSFDLSRITTPLPRPWTEYETGDSHLSTCDVRIKDLSGKSSSLCDIAHTPEIGYILCAADLMHRVSLRPKCRTEQDRLRSALQRLNENIPPELKKAERTQDGKPTVNSGTATLQLITLCTDMFLFSIDSPDRPDPRALEVARRIIGVLHLLNDANIGDVNLFAIIIWCRVAALMVWESKRLEAIDDAFAAASYAKDVQFILDTLKKMSHIRLAAEVYDMLQNALEADLSVFSQRADEERNMTIPFT